MTEAEMADIQARMEALCSHIQARFETGIIDFNRAEVAYAGSNVLRTEIYSDGSRLQFAGDARSANPHVPNGDGMRLWSAAPGPMPGNLDSLSERQIGPIVSNAGEGAPLAWEAARDVLFSLLKFSHRPARLNTGIIPDSVVNTMKDSQACKAILSSLVISAENRQLPVAVQPTLRKEAPKIPIVPDPQYALKLKAALIRCLISQEIEVHVDRKMHPWDADLDTKNPVVNVQKIVAGEVAASVIRLLGQGMDAAYEFEQSAEARTRESQGAFTRPTRNMKL